MFTLDPRLEADTVPFGAFPVSRLLLMRDARYRWFILVPERDDLRELHRLSVADRHAVSDETAAVADMLERLCAPDKINVAALGNMVPQLHVHVIARHVGDPAWPGPVWGRGEAVPYRDEEVEALRERVTGALAGSGFTPVG
ncbi:HIT domain-containing protein [Oceanibacterium hippocampi]|uniref:HIT domain protein n=1 Tax=Oceanibacterium hippocampi TaxID=745714 RepID=A0A1Y5RSM1_9PROT|nr:HIT domain-containing protein [Oceanibacterium hippocampi]SLN24385.1 HIT domain protein [Oceanibacterium hippocampi]